MYLISNYLIKKINNNKLFVLIIGTIFYILLYFLFRSKYLGSFSKYGGYINYIFNIDLLLFAVIIIMDKNNLQNHKNIKNIKKSNKKTIKKPAKLLAKPNIINIPPNFIPNINPNMLIPNISPEILAQIKPQILAQIKPEIFQNIKMDKQDTNIPMYKPEIKPDNNNTDTASIPIYNKK